ncbi:cysG, partial [Symbiodinium sp. CCMP2456]
DMDWAQMAKSAMQQTAVFYMGLKLLDKICTTLRSHGAPDETPMMLVESATSPLEKSLHSTLAEMPAEVEKQQACLDFAVSESRLCHQLSQKRPDTAE